MKDRNWPLETKFNRARVAPRYGFSTAFGMEWRCVKSFVLCFKMPRTVPDSIRIPGISPYRDEDSWKRIIR